LPSERRAILRRCLDHLPYAVPEFVGEMVALAPGIAAHLGGVEGAVDVAFE